MCGAAELVHGTRDMPYSYNSERTVIPAVTGDFCPACNEVLLDAQQGDRYSEMITAFNKQVIAAIDDPGC
jgi:HTH-type transcriptional regulator/antitoxin MqsA